MKKILATFVEGIERGIVLCTHLLIKLKEWLKRVKNAVFVKLTIKLSANILEGYSQQLIEVERGIRELRDALPQEDKIEKIAELTRKIHKKDLRAISAFITKISNARPGTMPGNVLIPQRHTRRPGIRRRQQKPWMNKLMA